MSTKFFRVIKASLRSDQINWLKDNFKTEMFMTDTYKNHRDLIDDFWSEAQYKFQDDNLNISESDFKQITGLSFKEYDDFMEKKLKEEKTKSFQEAKTEDLYVLEDMLNENKLSLNWTKNSINNLIEQLKVLENK